MIGWEERKEHQNNMDILKQILHDYTSRLFSFIQHGKCNWKPTNIF